MFRQWRLVEILIFCIFAIASLGARAEQFQLFDGGRFRNSYWIDTESYHQGPTFVVNGRAVGAGDTLILDTGETFTFKKLLGAESKTIVILSENEEVIRIPLDTSQLFLQVFKSYPESYRKLSQKMDQKYLVKVLPHQFSSKFSIKVEDLEIVHRLDFATYWEIIELDSQEYLELLEFIWVFRNLAESDDTSANQVGYVKGRGWVLFDYSMKMKWSDKSPTSLKDLHFFHELFDLESLRDSQVYRKLAHDLSHRISEQTQSSCQRITAPQIQNVRELQTERFYQ